MKHKIAVWYLRILTAIIFVSFIYFATIYPQVLFIVGFVGLFMFTVWALVEIS